RRDSGGPPPGAGAQGKSRAEEQGKRTARGGEAGRPSTIWPIPGRGGDSGPACRLHPARGGGSLLPGRAGGGKRRRRRARRGGRGDGEGRRAGQAGGAGSARTSPAG